MFDATGDLTIAGTTKTITMPVNILPVADPKQNKLEITGSISIKMTDFKVEPVDINIVLGHIKTGDDVKLVFKWVLWQKKAPAAAAK